MFTSTAATLAVINSELGSEYESGEFIEYDTWVAIAQALGGVEADIPMLIEFWINESFCDAL